MIITTLSEKIHEYLGWCPQGSRRKTRAFTTPEPDLTLQVPAPAGQAAPALTSPAECRPEYKTNLLLILLLLGGLFYASNLNLIIPFNLLSAVLVYFDAENIRAGSKFDDVKLLGEVATWRPIVWAAAVFIVPFILLLFYLCCRREVYNANN
jgi:hypothetical protein